MKILYMACYLDYDDCGHDFVYGTREEAEVRCAELNEQRRLEYEKLAAKASPTQREYWLRWSEDDRWEVVELTLINRGEEGG